MLIKFSNSFLINGIGIERSELKEISSYIKLRRFVLHFFRKHCF